MTSNFRERLSVPASWWIIAMFFGLTVGLALGFYLGPTWVLVLTLLVAALIAAALLRYGGVTVSVDDAELHAGPNRIDWAHVAGAEALDPDETRRVLGRDADAAAFRLVRPYVPTAVAVTVADPADPHPYWVLSSRRPAALAAAVNERARADAPLAFLGRAHEPEPVADAETVEDASQESADA